MRRKIMGQSFDRATRMIAIAMTVVAACQLLAPKAVAEPALEYPALTYSREQLVDRIERLARGSPPSIEDLESEFGLEFSSKTQAKGRPPLGDASVQLAGGQEAVYLLLPFGSDLASEEGLCITPAELKLHFLSRGWKSTRVEYFRHGATLSEEAMVISAEQGRRRLRFAPEPLEVRPEKKCPPWTLVLTYYR